ncbi:MAG: T9SS type A sorting domain-containing protein, partial [Chloroflexia bacterium]|nr:T9SS type A sorting domain-containing protein [Chloroflexia bacterium]
GTLYFTAGSENLLNLSVNRTASGTVGLGSDLSIGTSASGALTLTEGIIEMGANTLAVANVAQGAIVGGSSTAFVDGLLQRAFPSSTSGSSTYLFPIGEGGNYKLLELIDVTTGVSPSATVSVSATGATNPDPSIDPLLSERNWYVNSTNLTSAFVRITEDGMTAANTMGISTAAQSGAYTSAGGVGTATITSSSAVTTFPAWFAIGSSNIKTYYSYQDGDWSNPDTWTLDPSGTVKVGNTIPADGDDVIILSGRTVTLDADVTTTNLDITIDAAGFLNLSTYQFTNTLLSLNGQGTLQLASVNFPTVTSNTFVNANGGTTEYNNTSNFTLPAAQTEYNHLNINTAVGIVATQLNDLTLNGNLNVKQGTFRINDNSSTTALTLSIAGNVTVDNGAFITVGNGTTNTTIGGTGGTAPFLTYYTNFHTVIINGNLTNNGTIRFTNLNYPLYNAFPPTGSGATSGAATVYFQGSTDNTLTCNGVTDFYNLVLDKGVDQTYKLTINSSAYTNFKLFGANTLATDGAVVADPDMRKALWIRNGTLVLKGSLFIPSLTEGSSANSQYYIPLSGALIIDGVDVIVFTTSDDYREINTAYGVSAPNNATIGINTGSQYSSTYIFGKLQINKGYLSTRESGGLVTANVGSGQLIINGGTIDAKQFLSATGAASYNQVAGTFLLRGRFRRVPVDYSTVANLKDATTASLNTARAVNGVNSDYGTFNLENSGNVFTMSGGTIRIYDVCGIAGGQQEAFDVKSDVSNINVTGGTLELVPTTGSGLADAANFSITSTASLGNLTINRASSTSVVQLSTYPLTLLNNLTLTSGDLLANDLDVTVGGNLTFESGTTYTPGTNTTVLNGSGSQTFTINLASALSLNNLTINKSAGTSVSFAGSQNTVNVNSDFNLTLATLNDNGNTINVLGNVYNSGVHSGTGKIVLNGTALQTISGDGTFGNLELNNTNAATAPVSLTANTTINGELTFSQDKLFDIGTYNLKLNGSASIVGASSLRYIQMAGNSGDGGVTKQYSTTATFTFPTGVVSYTPAAIGLSAAPTAYGSITVKPVNYEHPNVTTTGRSLSYFWRVKSSGFTLGAATITHSYTYDDANIVTGGDVTEDEYVAARFDPSTNTWSSGTASDVDESVNLIGEPSSGTFLENVSFIDGDYTAGDNNPTNPFGTPVVYYSRQGGLWSDNNTWSFTGHAGGVAGSVPGARDIVIIGGQDSVYLATWTTTANRDPRSCATLQIEQGSALDIGYNPASGFSMVVSHPNGNGNFRITTSYTSGSTFAFPSGDFSDFNQNLGTTELYSTNATSGTTYWLPNGVMEYGTLIISPTGGSNIIFPNNDVLIYGDLITRGQNSESWFCPTWNSNYPTAPTARAAKTITIEGDFRIEGGAFIYYGNNALAQDIIINGDLFVNEFAGIRVYSNATNQSISIGGDLINNAATGTGVNTYAGAIFTNIPLTFFGTNDAFVTNTAGTPTTTIGTLTVNKGTSQSTTLTCNIGGTLTTPTNNWLTLQNGTFIYNRTGNFTISTTTDFVIPTTSGLTINTPSNVYIANTTNNNETLGLNGKLTIANGTVYVGPAGNTANNADIQYSAGGYSEIEISGGQLFVTGHIRRPLTSTNGVLKYTQSGGDVFIYGNRNQTTRGKLEIANTGSEFNMSNGTINIVHGGGVDYGDVYLRPESLAVTGGEIIFTPQPSSGPVVDADQNYILDANTALHHLTVTGKTSGTSRTATLDLNINPLVVNGDLTLSTTGYTVFNTNDLNVTIGGDFTNNGTYNYGTNLTTFNGTTQSISGSSTTNFYDLDVSPTSSLTVNNSFTVNGNLDISSGNLVLGTNSLTLLGDLTNEGAYTDDNNTGGISLAGSALQSISGTGAYGRLELNNSSGATLANSITIQNNLVMTTGVLDISQYQLSLSQNTSILGAPFGVDKMIKSDGVASSLGIRKFFPIISAPTTFTFPTGVSGKYTPAEYSITNSATVGSITVNPINTYHPTVLDADSVLQYYWAVESSGISNFSGALVLEYLDADVEGIESEYVAARLEIPGDYWYKAATGAATDNVDEALNTITFNASGSSNLSADYTAGSRTAIPDQVPSYRTNQDGDWSDQNIWTPIGTAPVCPPGGPNGAIVIIDHIVYTSTNYSSAYRTTINNELQIIAPTFGHNLGVVNGTDGTLYVETGNLPAGNYTEFLDCDGNGTLNYGGTGSYTNIASLYNSVPNLVFSGTGSRTLYNKDLTICKRLVIDGPTLDNSVNNKKFTIQGTMEIYNTGSFVSGTGDAPMSTVTFAGTAGQNLGGPLGDFTGANSFNNLEIDNAAGLTIGASGNITVKNDLLLTNGVINTSSATEFVVENTDIDAVTPTGGSTTSYISGPLTKQIINGDDFIFPLGKDADKGHDFTLTSEAGSTLFWTAEFFTPNTTATSLNSPLLSSNAMEYWSVSTTTTADAKIKIAWDSQSNLTAAMTENGLSDMRVADFDGSNWNEIVSTPSGSLSNGAVETTNNVSLSTTPTDFTTASITITTPSARLSPAGAICGNVGIPVTFTSFSPISLPYTIDYEIDGVPQTTEVINALPYSLPTPVQGAYQLTGFTYTDGGVQTGLVDDAIVNAYDVPTTANAGSDQALCGLSGTTLDGNDPSPYSGLWTVISGTGGTLVDNNTMNTVFTGVLDETYTLRWTISNFACTSSNDVQITFDILPARPSDFTAALTPVCLESTGNLYTVPNDVSVTYNWSYTGAGADIDGSGNPANGIGNSVLIDFDATATSGTLSVVAENGCGVSTSRTVSIIVNPRGSWVGDYNTDWFDIRNWTCPGIPIASSDVTIPSGSTYMPVISSTGALCNNLTIDPGASLTLSGSSSLDIYGDFTNDDTFTASATSTVTFAGTTVIDGSSDIDFGNVTIDGDVTAPSFNMNIAGDLSVNGSFTHNNGSVTFNGGTAQTIDGASGELVFYDLTINSGADVSVTASSQITVANNTDISGDFTLESPADDGPTASFIDNGITHSGTAHVQRHIIRLQYHYITSPIQTPDIDAGSNAKSNLFTSFGSSSFNPNFYSYNEAYDLDGNPGTAPTGYDPNGLVPGWTFLQRYAANPVVDMENGRGYSFYTDVNGLRTFNGKLNTGDMSVSGLSYTDNDPTVAPPQYYDGWHLVGNPYPSCIDWDLISGGLTNLDNAVYVWDGANSRYASYVSGIGTNGQTNIITAMQGFFVHANADGAGFTLNNSHRLHDAATTFKGAKAGPAEIIRLVAQTSAGRTDEAVVYFNASAAEGYDGRMDAFTKFSWNTQTYPGYYNYEDIPNLYTLINDNNVALSINALPETSKENKVIPLGLRLGTTGDVSISKQAFSIYNTNVYLVDKLEDNIVHLNTSDNYSFHFEKGDVKDRFELRFNINNAPTLAQDINDKTYNENETFSFVIPENTFVESDLGDHIVSYYAKSSDGSALPQWLSFNAETLSFAGVTTFNDAGAYNIKLYATDIHSAAGECEFTLTINNVNNAPTLTGSIPDQEVDVNTVYSYKIPEDLFYEPDSDDKLTLTAKLSNGNDLPGWLTFNGSENLIYGSSQNSGEYNIKVIATDNYGASVSEEYKLTVKATATGIEDTQENIVKLSPNPTAGMLYLELSKPEANTSVAIRDFNGKRVLQRSINAAITELNLSEFAAGVYFIELTNGEKITTYKVVLNK